MNAKPLLLAAIAAASLLAGLTRSDAVVVAFDPASATLDVGESVSIAIVIDRQGGPAIGGWSARITYDPAIVGIGAGGIDYGTNLDLGGMGSLKTAPNTSTPGVISSLIEVSFEDAGDLATSQPDSFTLATIQFTAVKAGATGLVFDLAGGTSVSDADGIDISSRVMFTGGLITVKDDGGTSIPEPSRAIGLAAITLIGLLHRRRP